MCFNVSLDSFLGATVSITLTHSSIRNSVSTTAFIQAILNVSSLTQAWLIF